MLLAVPLGVGCGGDDEEKPAAPDCQKYCQTAKMLNCANESLDGCVNTCTQRYSALLTASPECKPEIDQAAICLAGRSASDFECNADGWAQPKPQVCANEQSKATSCVIG
jgi:hypothetical protein